MSSSILTLGAAQLVARFRARSLSPIEVMDAVLRQLAATEPVLNAYVIRQDPERLRRDAAESHSRWAAGRPMGALDGIPLAVKDAILAAGFPNRVGSRTTPPVAVREDAPSVARVREAGAIILGKSTTPEFGWKGVTDSPLTGVSRNPWNPAMSCGGSSGGSAAAVAAGSAVAALGTDAGGSVRIPASFCGLVAIKASRGRVPAYPPSAVWTLGHIGPITRNVRDAALMMNVITAPDPRDWNALPPDSIDYVAALLPGLPAGLRVAYSPMLGHARVDPEVAAAVEAVAERLSRMGARVTCIEAPLPDARQHFRTYFDAALAHSVRQLGPESLELLDAGLRSLVARAGAIGRGEFLEAYEFQMRIGREARLFHVEHDLLLTPTMAVAPFEAGRLSPAGYDPSNWLDWSPFTYPFNLTGQPALSLPCGFTAAGLPIGAQLVGPMYGDALVLRVAHALEQAGLFEPLVPPLLS